MLMSLGMDMYHGGEGANGLVGCDARGGHGGHGLAQFLARPLGILRVLFPSREVEQTKI